jgi:hypothetical protein
LTFWGCRFGGPIPFVGGSAMMYYMPYMLALVFAAIAWARGQEPRRKDFWQQLAISLLLMLVIRDFFNLLAL